MDVAVESHRPFPLMESQTKSRTGRHRLLYTWGVSLLAIAHKAYIMVEEIHGPFGSLAQRLASLASPIIYTMQYQWLEILSFVDDQILAIEDMLETLFPPSAYFFDRIDMLTDICWILAGKLDHIMDRYPMVVIDQAPFLNWAATHLSIGLNFLISTMTEWDNNRAKEEIDIFVDISCDEHASETPVEDPKGAKQVLKHNSIEKTPIFDEPQHTETKVATTEKLYTDDNVEKPSIIDDIEHNENKAGMAKKAGVDDHDHIEKSPIFDDTKYAETKTDVTKKLPVFDDTKHAETKVGMPNKTHILDGDARRHVDRVCREILGALEKIVTKESGIRSQAIHTVPIREAPSQVQTQEADVKDDMILELFDAGWHSQRGSRRGA